MSHCYNELLHATTELMHTQARHTVVGGRVAPMTDHGGGTPARNAHGTTAYQALLVSKCGHGVMVEAQWSSCGGV